MTFEIGFQLGLAVVVALLGVVVALIKLEHSRIRECLRHVENDTITVANRLNAWQLEMARTEGSSSALDKYVERTVREMAVDIKLILEKLPILEIRVKALELAHDGNK